MRIQSFQEHRYTDTTVTFYKYYIRHFFLVPPSFILDYSLLIRLKRVLTS
jgi:hypothetical protein